MKSIAPSAEDRALMDDLKAALKKHEDHPPMRMLAIASQLVGNLVALQDQSKVTPAMAMRLVEENIVLGNETAIAELRDRPAAGRA